LFPTVGTGGGAKTIVVVELDEFGWPEIVRVTVYVPDAAGMNTGFCCEDVKPFGPVHAYVAPATVGEAVSVTDEPAQTPEGSVLLEATTEGTETFMTTVAAGSAIPG
jgi:hypothetical protein